MQWHNGSMNRSDLPLLLASDRFAGDHELEPLDRLRMQKGIFLLAQKGSAEWRDLFSFRPYDWGPYSSELATEVRLLTQSGHLSNDASYQFRYGSYRTTVKGEQRLEEVKLSDKQARFIGAVRAFVTSRPFKQLLTDIYAVFPSYATASKFVSGR